MTNPYPIQPPNTPLNAPGKAADNSRNIIIICLIAGLIIAGATVYFFMLMPASTPAEPVKTSDTTRSPETLESKISDLEKQNKELSEELENLSEDKEAVIAPSITLEETATQTTGETAVEPAPANTILSNVFSVDEVKIGDTIAGMKLISLEPANPEYSALSNDNAVADFSGLITINGKWEHFTEEFIMGEMVCFTPDTESNKLLPAITGNERDGRFCFSNDDEAKKEFSPVGGSGTAKVLISDFTYFSYPSEGSNTATLVKILKNK